jgi:hypothetical protein
MEQPCEGQPSDGGDLAAFYVEDAETERGEQQASEGFAFEERLALRGDVASCFCRSGRAARRRSHPVTSASVITPMLTDSTVPAASRPTIRLSTTARTSPLRIWRSVPQLVPR